MEYEVSDIVYGDSLEATIFAFVNNLPIVHEGHKLYHDFDLFDDLETLVLMGFLFSEKTYPTNKGDVKYYAHKEYFRDVLLLILAISGLTLNHDKVDSARIKGNQLEFVCGNRKDYLTFKKIYLFENRKLTGYFKRTKDAHVYDHFYCRSTYPYRIVYDSGQFVKEIYRLGHHEMVTYSVIKDHNLNKDNYSVVAARLKMKDKIKKEKLKAKAFRFLARDIRRVYMPVSDRDDIIPITSSSEEICRDAAKKGILNHVPQSQGAYHWRIARLLLGKNGIIATPLLDQILQRWRMQLSLQQISDAKQSGLQPRISGYQFSKKG